MHENSQSDYNLVDYKIKEMMLLENFIILSYKILYTDIYIN